MKSSLTFQVLLHLGSYFFGFFCVVEVLLIFYKALGKLLLAASPKCTGSAAYRSRSNHEKWAVSVRIYQLH